MRKYIRYSHGFLLGICLEYLYRVDSEFWIYPLIISLICLALIIIDIITKDTDNVELNGLDEFINQEISRLRNPKIKDRK